MVSNLTTNTTLLYDNYETVSPVSSAAAYNSSPDADPTAVIGSWSLQERDSGGSAAPGIFQVTDFGTPGPAEGNQYLRVYRDATFNQNDLLGSLASAQTTPGQVIHWESMVNFDSDVSARAQLILVGSSLDYTTAASWIRPNGAGFVATVDLSLGSPVVNTSVPYAINTWQKWTMDYVIGASTFSFSVDGMSGTGTTANTGGVYGFYAANGNNAPGSFYLDAVVPEPSTMTMMLFGALSLAAAARRRRR